MPWRDYFQTCVVGIGVAPSEFWKMTIPEFWSLYDLKFGHIPQAITRDDLLDMMDRNPDR